MSLTVLIVDDNAINLKLARQVLELAGHQVLTAVDAGQAQEVLASSRPDLVLMDISLPGMDGLSLVRLLRGDARHAGLRIVALSALAMKEDVARALDAGCDGFLSKPIDTRRFADDVAAFAAPQEVP
ncbi:MAG: response regulator [Xanthomonadales bacterium]|nr:response regulator [Xanthomonadales bacterium]